MICIILLRLVLSPRSGHCSNSAMKGRWPKALKKVFLLVVPELLQFLCFHCVVHSPHPPKRGNCPSVTVPPPPMGGELSRYRGGDFKGRLRYNWLFLPLASSCTQFFKFCFSLGCLVSGFTTLAVDTRNCMYGEMWGCGRRSIRTVDALLFGGRPFPRARGRIHHLYLWAKDFFTSL